MTCNGKKEDAQQLRSCAKSNQRTASAEPIATPLTASARWDTDKVGKARLRPGACAQGKHEQANNRSDAHRAFVLMNENRARRHAKSQTNIGGDLLSCLKR